MCGLSGFNFKDSELIQKMNRTLNYRGPDHSDVYLDEQISLGHVLLAIRDHDKPTLQPYTEEQSEWVLLFNGEIYNTPDIKKKISTSFSQVKSDTVILFELIKMYGWQFIDHIHGMFAIALYNKAEKKVNLYRDPSGQKCLYYYLFNGKFIFSSEIKGILCFQNVDKKMDKEAIEISCILGYIPGNKTIFQFINKVLPAEIVQFDLVNKRLSNSLHSFKETSFENLSAKNVLSENMRIHLQANKELALNLSGGLDSTSLLAEASEQDYRMFCFTTGFEGSDPKYKEDKDLAQKLAQHFNQKLEVLNFKKSDYFENYTQAYSLIEEPNYNIALPLYHFIAKKIGRSGAGFRVLFSGDGGDELFGGYDYYLTKNNYIDKRINKFGSLTYNAIAAFKTKLWLNYQNPTARYGTFKFFKEDISPKIKKKHFEILDQTASLYGLLFENKNDNIYKSMIMDRIFWQASENFIRNDKLYMQQSIEMRAPLSYHPLRNYFDKKINIDEYITKNQNKITMRKIYKDKLPSFILERKNKMGWHPPLKEWHTPDTLKFYQNLIEKRTRRDSEVIDWKKINQHLKNVQGPIKKEMNIYFSIACILDHFGLET